jgi:hypothetical protein
MSATITNTAGVASWVEIIVPPEVQAEGMRVLGVITDAAPKIAEVLQGLTWLMKTDQELHAKADDEAAAAGSIGLSDGLGEIIANLDGLSAIYTVLDEVGIDLDDFARCYHAPGADQ